MSLPVPPRVVLFDIDGTLLDAGGAGRLALERAFEELWGIASAAEGVVFAGRTDPEIIRDIMLKRLELTSPVQDPALLRDVLGAYLRNLPPILAQSSGFKVLPGARALVEILAREPATILGLATGNIAPAARLKLAKGRLNAFFRTGGFGADAPSRAGVVAAALARIGRIAGKPLDRGRVVLVGDTVRDIKAGLATGVVPVGVATGPDSVETLVEAGARLALPSLADPEPLLELLRASAR